MTELFLQVHGIETHAWRARWDLMPVRGKCGDCNGPMEANIPFAYENKRGIMAGMCVCGSDKTPYGFIELPCPGKLTLNDLGTLTGTPTPPASPETRAKASSRLRLVARQDTWLAAQKNPDGTAKTTYETDTLVSNLKPKVARAREALGKGEE